MRQCSWDGAGVLLTSGSSYCRGQPGRISCPSILSQFLAHKQPLLEMVPYIYNLSFKVFLLIFVQLFLPRAVFVPAILKGCGQFLGHLYPILFYVFELSSKKKKKSQPICQVWKKSLFHLAVVLTLLHIICQKFGVIQ